MKFGNNPNATQTKSNQLISSYDNGAVNLQPIPKTAEEETILDQSKQRVIRTQQMNFTNFFSYKEPNQHLPKQIKDKNIDKSVPPRTVDYDPVLGQKI